MKTLDEVIKAMETDPVPMAYTARLSVHEDIMTDALEWLKAYKGHIELDKLRDKCEAKNDPLTWDELKQMEGKPIWIEYNIKRKDRTLLAWCLVLIVLDEYMSVQTNAVAFRVNKSEIGTKWQAYRKERS